MVAQDDTQKLVVLSLVLSFAASGIEWVGEA
jgi:hypothetical protein